MNSQEAKKLENKVQNILRTYLNLSQTDQWNQDNHYNNQSDNNSDNQKVNHSGRPISIIAGISGGSDSVFLLECLSKALPALPNLKIIVAHINHSLRGKDSENDEKFVRNYVQDLNAINNNPNNNNDPDRYTNKSSFILFHSKKLNIKSLSKKSHTGTEETARKKRYEYFLQLAKKYKASFIITAHHADDNLETILLNLTRGATLQGLCGMQIIDLPPFATSQKFSSAISSHIPFNASSHKFSPSISARADFPLLFRPLLSITKKEITEYLKFKKIHYRTDKSNFSDEYNRNLIRNKVLPSLLKINPSISKTIAKNTESLREISDFLAKQAKNWIKKHVTSNGHASIKSPHIHISTMKSTTNASHSSLSFPSKPFRTLHPALQKQILLSLYKELINSTQDLETIHIEEVLTLINQNIGNKQKKFGKTIISIKKNIITIKSSK